MKQKLVEWTLPKFKSFQAVKVYYHGEFFCVESEEL